MTKRLLEQQESQGWSFTSLSVCASCVEEEVLENAVTDASDEELTCDFCRSSVAAPLDALLAVFVPGVRRLYNRAIDELFYDGREGGYQGPTLDTHDMLQDFADVLTGEGLLEAVGDAIGDDEWIAKGWPLLGVEDALKQSWDAFCHQVKHETRYVIWRRDSSADDLDPDEIPPAQILDAIGTLVDLYPEDLTTELGVDELVWRARPHDMPPGFDLTPAELGTTPVEKSRGNRMSPGGIPMFYAALDSDTAILEAAQGTTHTHATVSAWHTSRPVKLLNLTNLRPIPSLFAPDGDERPQWVFLHYFAKSLRARATLPEIDYVPTQVVTEYFLKVFGEGHSLEGLQYGSDVDGGGICVVLDVKNAYCLSELDQPEGNDRLAVHLVSASVSTCAIP